MNIKTVLKSSVAAAALFAIAAPVATTANAADDTLKSGNKNSLTISGFVARAFYWADDGVNSGLFNTASETGQSRVRWIASGTINENVTMGSMIEMEIPKSNDDTVASFAPSGAESGQGDATGWKIRHQYVWVSHKTLGKISLGNTNTASNGGVQASFAKSGGTTGTHDNKSIGSGFIFLDTSTNPRGDSTGVDVGNATSDLDFGSRDDVIRYDTPKFGGAKLAISLNDKGSGEIGGTYGGKFGSVKINARAGYQATSSSSTRREYILGGSLAVLHDSGLHAAIAAATAPDKLACTATSCDQSNVYAQVGYNAKIFGAGVTGFNFSWNRSINAVARGSVGENFGVTVGQYFDSVGATMALVYRNYSYQNDSIGDRTIDDIDVFGLATVFKF